MDIKALLLKKYPNLKINNEFFLNDDYLKHLSLDEIAYFSALSKEDGWIVNHYIFYYGVEYDNFNEMTKYVFLNNKEMISTIPKISIFAESLIRKEYEKLYLKQEFTNEMFKSIHIKNQINIDKNISSANVNLFDEILIAQKLYSERKLSEEEIRSFKDFYFEYIKRKTNHDYSLKENKRDIDFNFLISQSTEALLEGKINLNNFYDAMNNRDSLSSLIMAGKTGFPIGYTDVPVDVLNSIKGTSIKNIVQDIDSKENEKLLMRAVIKMIAYLGVNNTITTIKHINDEDALRRVLYQFKDIDLNGVKVKNGKILYNEEFIKLFMGNNINEPGSILNKTLRNETRLGFHLQSIYNFWEELDRRFKNQTLKTRYAFLENAFLESEVFLNPDEYLLEGEVINSYYDNNQFQYLSKDELIAEIRKLYKEMKHKYQKTIPYVSGNKNGVYYETLKASDPTLLEMGNLTSCCFKIGGDADSFVKYCALDKNARVICFKNQLGEIIGMSPIIRNGNMVICNSLEMGRDFDDNCFLALKEAAEKMINISDQYEDKEHMIKGVLIGNYKNKLEEKFIFERTRMKIDTRPLDDSVYANMGIDYDTYKVAGIYEKETELKEFEPKIIYLDPREKIKDVEKGYIGDSVKKRINSIYFEKNGKIIEDDTFDKVEYLSYNTDWFSLITSDGLVISDYIPFDSRSVDEYNETLESFKEFNSYTR